MLVRKGCLAVAVLCGLQGLGCSRKSDLEGEPPPPPAPAGPCQSTPSGPLSPLPGFPLRAGGYCIDPTVDLRSYGTGALAPLDSVCVELFNGECELYKSYGLTSVKTFQYAPLAGGQSRVNAVMSEFRAGQGAYGFFTRRVLGGGSPSELTVEPLELSGQGALGPGVAYVRRGRRVVELTYVSETETPDEVRRSSKTALAELGLAVSSALGGDERPPLVALRASLPGLFPLAIELPCDGLLGLVGSGAFAVAHYVTPGPAHRLVVLEAADEPAAKDVVRLLRTGGASQTIKGRDVVVVKRAAEEQAPEIWHFSRTARLVLGVGPADRPEPRPQPSPAERKELEDRWAVFALKRLDELRQHALSLGP